MMRFFSHEWAVLDDIEADQISTSYWSQLDRIDEKHGVNLGDFAARINLGDAILDSARFESKDQSILIRYVHGDNQSGYFITEVRYHGAKLCDDLNHFRSIIESRIPRIRFDEFDEQDTGLLCHRLLFWPREFGELTINFANISETSISVERRGHYAQGELVEIA